jgi:two-component system cell cycle sensor histidine kinase/response regulator CckA
LRFTDLVEVTADGSVKLAVEGEQAPDFRMVHVPLEGAGDGGAGTVLLIESHAPGTISDSSNVQALLEILPIGLALVDRDGRFLTMNQAFRIAASIKGAAMPVYPSDLVVKEDKGAVADAVRRNARGPAMSQRHCDPPCPKRLGTGGAHHRRPARSRRCGRAPAPQGQ